MYSLMPGYLAPEREQEYIDEVVSNHVRYVLIANANRYMVEYQMFGFYHGDYNQQIYRWIMDNFVKVGQFGPLPDADHRPYIVWVYEKRELARDN